MNERDQRKSKKDIKKSRKEAERIRICIKKYPTEVHLKLLS
jgi:hypothetical protein